MWLQLSPLSPPSCITITPTAFVWLQLSPLSPPPILSLSHWVTKCPKAHRVITHNKMQDVVAAMYRALYVHATVEVRGLYAQLTSYREHKPENVLILASATGTDKATALNITITDPTNKTALDRGSDRKPLAAANPNPNPNPSFQALTLTPTLTLDL